MTQRGPTYEPVFPKGSDEQLYYSRLRQAGMEPVDAASRTEAFFHYIDLGMTDEDATRACGEMQPKAEKRPLVRYKTILPPNSVEQSYYDQLRASGRSHEQAIQTIWAVTGLEPPPEAFATPSLLPDRKPGASSQTESQEPRFCKLEDDTWGVRLPTERPPEPSERRLDHAQGRNDRHRPHHRHSGRRRLLASEGHPSRRWQGRDLREAARRHLGRQPTGGTASQRSPGGLDHAQGWAVSNSPRSRGSIRRGNFACKHPQGCEGRRRRGNDLSPAARRLVGNQTPDRAGTGPRPDRGSDLGYGRKRTHEAEIAKSARATRWPRSAIRRPTETA